MSIPTVDPLAAVADLPEVSAAVAESRAAVDRLRAHKILRNGADKVTAESALRGARASAALAGADWPLEELRRRTDLGSDADAAPVRGALRISAELSGLLPVLNQAPAQAFSRMHVLAAAGALPAARLGRPRAPGESVECESGWAGPADDRLSVPTAGPIPAREAAQRLSALTRLLAAPTAAPALVVAAVALGEFVSAQPFGWGDGLVGRAAFRLVLAARGLDPQSLATPEVGLVELGAQERRTALAGYASGSADGVSGWIVFCARAVELGAAESVAVCEALMRG